MMPVANMSTFWS